MSIHCPRLFSIKGYLPQFLTPILKYLKLLILQPLALNGKELPLRNGTR